MIRDGLALEADDVAREDQRVLGEKKFRIHQVAKKLNKSSKEVMEACGRLGIQVKSHLSSVTEEEYARIRDSFSQPADTPAASPAAAAAAETTAPKAKTSPPPGAVSPVGPMGITRRPIADLDQLARKGKPESEQAKTQERSRRPVRSRSRPVPQIHVPPPPTSPQAGRTGQKQQTSAEPQERVQQPKKRLTPELLRKIRERQKQQLKAAQEGPSRGTAPGETGQPPAPPAARDEAKKKGIRIVAVPKVELAAEEETGGRRGGRRGGAVAGRRMRRERRERRKENLITALESLEETEEEEQQALRAVPFRQRKAKDQTPAVQRPSRVEIEPPITVRSFSEATGIKVSDILKKLLLMGRSMTINSHLDPEDAQLLGIEFGIEVEVKLPKELEEEVFARIKPDPNKMVPRPPVVTLLGHVDHGKTSLLDRIRKTNIVASEAGGITQCIRAWQVEYDGKKITFLDTPGHEAFTAMRARGAQVTDIAVIVVAADDGVMPQTEEAISHAKAAGVQIIVAINKCDLPQAKPERVLHQLANVGILPEEWDMEHGVPCIRCSALTGEGIDDLLEHILLLAEAMDLKADPTVPAIGTCLEAARHEGRGVLATLLIEQGTLHRGDVVVCGLAHGRIRSMWNDQERMIKEAGPGTPVLVSGLDEVPEAGERFVVASLDEARKIVERRRERAREGQVARRTAVTLESLLSGNDKKQLPLVIRADVRGSLEAIEKELSKFQDDEVEVRILHKDVGAITESDVLLAEASHGIIVGFNVGIEPKARQLAEQRRIEVRRYNIIYELSDDIRAALEGMLTPERHVRDLGEAEVLQVFKIRGVGRVAGCRVRRGRVLRSSYVRVLRDGRVIYPDPTSERHVRVASLKRFQDDVQEVRSGYECGIRIEGFDDIKPGDVLEFYEIQEIRRKLGQKRQTPEPAVASASR